MDNGIALIAIVVAAVVGSTIVWLALRRNLPPDAAEALAAYVAAIRSQLSGVVDEDMIRTIAGALWDQWGDGAKYFTRDEFIGYVLRALYGSNAAQFELPMADGFAPRDAFLRIIPSNQGQR